MISDNAYELKTLIVHTSDNQLKNELPQVFANEPYKIELYSNSFKLLQSILRRPVLVCIYDVGKARKEKLESIPVITRVKPDISLIVLCDADSEKLIKKIHQNHLYYFFQKPFDYDELLVAVRSAFEFHQKRIYARGW